MSKCPLCNKKSMKVIYYGFPTKFCCNTECNCMFGFWTYLTDWLPYNGVMFKYKGSYLKALWRWLKG